MAARGSGRSLAGEGNAEPMPGPMASRASDEVHADSPGSEAPKRRTNKRGRGRAKGRESLALEVYSKLCELMLSKQGREYMWGRTYLTLAWNLMLRNSHVCNLRYEQLEFTGDALRFYEGTERYKNPKHVYANPVNPEICPILALGNKDLSKV
eukprot:571640-Hanusia_phi.AAC.9